MHGENNNFNDRYLFYKNMTNNPEYDENWLRAQRRELSCWLLLKDKVSNPLYLSGKKKYWNKIILKIEPFIKNSKSVLDIGCGPSGIFLSLNDNVEKVGIDSLMDSYLKEFAFLNDLSVKWISAPFEDYVFNQKFDAIFIFNALDHMKDPDKVIDKVKHILNRNGILIISLNLHTVNLIQKIITALPFLDPLHPHQYTLPQIIAKLSNYGFRCVLLERIDDVRIALEQEVDKLEYKKERFTKKKSLVYFIKSVIRKIFYSLLRVKGYPPHSLTPNGKSIWAEYLLVFVKK